MQERRRVLSGETSLRGTVDGSESVVLDVVFASNDGSLVQIVHGLENWPNSGWTPIGIVVVPGTHNRYGDGSCGIMSLVPMSRISPESGISVVNYTTDSNIYNNMTSHLPMWGNTTNVNVFVSTTALTSSTNLIVKDTSYTFDSGVMWPYEGTLGSPTANGMPVNMTSNASTQYDNNGSYVTATSGKSGCDFNGIRNTAGIYIYSRSSTNWTGSINNSYSTFCYPAIQCCGRFKTIGTSSFLDIFNGTTLFNSAYGTQTSSKDNKGFWYMPAEGELCYLDCKLEKINNVISALNLKYGNVASSLHALAPYISSSVYDTNNVWCIHTSGDVLMSVSKKEYDLTRAFMRL